MNAFPRLKTLYYLTLSPIRGESHEERLESFYRHQAGDYDAFREKMLHGRDELFTQLPANVGDVWVDLGAGTGRNAERFGERLECFSSAQLVDLSGSLLAIAERRIQDRGWENAKAIHADATTLDIPNESVDLVTFAYSLTMIPKWFSALENARRMLKPGGMIGVVDFYVSHKHPDAQRVRHGWFTRTFWPTWFALDNVFPSVDHLPLLTSHFESVYLQERRGKIPWLPLIRAPHYIFIGRKPSTCDRTKHGDHLLQRDG